MNLVIVIAAAGSGRRFGGDKLSATIRGRTVLETSVEHLRAALPGAPIVVVVETSGVDEWRSVLAVDAIIAGGKRRQDSVRAGVEVAAERGASHVVIHDGARPAVHPDDVLSVVRAVDGIDGAILCARVSDTVKKVGEDETVIETLDRDHLRLALTPQVVRVAALESAWQRQDLSREWSDEAALIEADGGQVRCATAKHPNPKITTAADLEMARMICGDES
jgi:2-C-methyl-D-erythritol 4-phosphate cytidylyltransferase